MDDSQRAETPSAPATIKQSRSTAPRTAVNGGSPPPPPTPEAVAAVAAAQRAGVGVENAEERTIVLRQMYVGLVMIVGGAAVATVGIVLVKESDSTKLTAIIALATAVIGAGAALLPTGAAAGASARILSRPQAHNSTDLAPALESAPSQSTSNDGGQSSGSG